MAWAAVGAAAVSVVGGAISANNAPGAPKPMNVPMRVTTGLGTSTYTPGKKKAPGSMSSTLSAEQQAFANQYGDLANKYLQGRSATQPYQQWAMGDVQGMMPGMFGNALDASAVDSQSLQQYLAALGGTAGGMNQMFQGAGAAGMNALGQPIVGSGMAGQMFGMGQGLMGATPGNYQDVYNQRLGLLRQSAAPFEQRAGDAFMGRQFGMGRMGTTGGQRDIQGFAAGLDQADTTRQLDAMNLSEALYGRDQQAALQQQGMGAGLMGAGLSGLLGGYGAQTGAATSLLGLSGQLGLGTAGMYGSGYGATQGMNELTNTRAQQRMTNAQNIFGFGNDLGMSDLSVGTGLNQQQLNMYQQQLEAAKAAQGGGTGGQVQTTGNPVASGLGSALQGFGSAWQQNPGMFGGGGTVIGSYTPPGINPNNYNVTPTPNFSGIAPPGGI